MKPTDEKSSARRERLLQEVARVEALLQDRQAALPAHSVRPHQIQEVEELEEELSSLKKELEKLSQG
ncbi:MAG: histidine kinase [Deltaproteobacteria bacterium]|nr:histidine kinase [Deltaproteobacteria bacterium]